MIAIWYMQKQLRLRLLLREIACDPPPSGLKRELATMLVGKPRQCRREYC